MAARCRFLTMMVNLVLPVLLAPLSLTAATTYSIKWAKNSISREFAHRVAFLEVGDVLNFHYNTKDNDLLEVTFDAFLECSNSESTVAWTDGNTSIAYSEPNILYYICGYPGHCVAKQYLIVRVMDKGAYALTPTSSRPVVEDDGIRFGEESSSVAQWDNASLPISDDVRVQLLRKASQATTDAITDAYSLCGWGGCWPYTWWCWFIFIYCCPVCSPIS